MTFTFNLYPPQRSREPGRTAEIPGAGEDGGSAGGGNLGVLIGEIPGAGEDGGSAGGGNLGVLIGEIPGAGEDGGSAGGGNLGVLTGGAVGGVLVLDPGVKLNPCAAKYVREIPGAGEDGGSAGGGNLGVLIGGAVGGVLVLAGLGSLAHYLVKKKKSKPAVVKPKTDPADYE
ncbi:acanthoscurrin-1-like [Branchiostoma floridae]|uniref:Acanthoscurrin-1-like n=1 Tax=Branchiostoma floridae TaxID=7739 RepID=A0A9J7NCE4_BRAFL|nr:acanthoscurrin-1-like [Branchiostoma floridae]